jgi:hypothetical protein
MDTVGVRVSTRQMRIYTFSVSSVLRYSPSAICAISANYTYIRFFKFSAKQ